VAIIGMRELLRDPKKVFSEIEEKREPILVTNHGRPVAALYPVDANRAEQLMLEATSEYVESRRRAENARAEGRTRSLDQAIQEYNAGVEAGAQIETEAAVAAPALPALELDSTEPAAFVPMAELRAIFGTKLAGIVAREVDQRVYAISESLVGSAEGTGLLVSKGHEAVGKSEDREGDIRRVRALNAQLFGEVMRGILLQAAKERIAALDEEAPDVAYAVGSEGMFGWHFAEETLETAEAHVKHFNGEILRLARSHGAGTLLTTYAASIEGATAFGRVGHVGGPPADFIRRQR
jgi:PHD/YefM family antitoxin component YafN of YafNO toxin-antitoxin module